MPETFASGWAFTNYGMLYWLRQAYLFLDSPCNLCLNCIYVISKESGKVTAAKITFIGLTGQQVSGTILLIKDSNDVWKIDNLQNM